MRSPCICPAGGALFAIMSSPATIRNHVLFLMEPWHKERCGRRTWGPFPCWCLSSRWGPDEPRRLFRQPERKVHQQWLEQGSSESDRHQHPIRPFSWPRGPAVWTGAQCGPQEQLWHHQRAPSGGRVGWVSVEQRLRRQVRNWKRQGG